LELSGIIDQAE